MVVRPAIKTAFPAVWLAAAETSAAKRPRSLSARNRVNRNNV